MKCPGNTSAADAHGAGEAKPASTLQKTPRPDRSGVRGDSSTKVRSSMATATDAAWREESVYSVTAAKRRTERLPRSATIARLPVQKSAKRRMAAAISSKAKKIARTGKHVENKTKIQKDDQVDSWKDDRSPEYHPDSPEYHPNSDEKVLLYIQHSPSTEQRLTENEQREYMVTATQALEYYHKKYPDDLYEPVHVNINQVRQIIEGKGYYIHMNFEARNIKTRAEKIFFAELFLSAMFLLKIMLSLLVVSPGLILLVVLGMFTFPAQFYLSVMPWIWRIAMPVMVL